MSRKTTTKTATVSSAENTVAVFRDAYEALFDPGEAAALRARAEAMLGLRALLKTWNGTQAEKAARLGITQPRFALLMTGKLSAVSVDFAAKMAARAGMEMRISYTKPKKAKLFRTGKHGPAKARREREHRARDHAAA